MNAHTPNTAADNTAADTVAALLRASNLPQRWQGRERFVLLDCDFDCGKVFIDTWRTWRADRQRCGRLTVVAVCPCPPTGDVLRRAHKGAGDATDDCLGLLLAAWPPPTPDLHTLVFDDGRVRLLLAVGELRSRLPDLRLRADAIVAKASAFEAEPRLGNVLGRKAALGATLAVTVDTAAAGPSLAALQRSGFVVREVPYARLVIAAEHAPRFAPPPLPDAGVQGRQAVVVGAGIAGASAAQALAAAGFEVTVLDRHQRPAAEASGNPAGLFHGVVHGTDGPYARLYRAAALRAHDAHAQAIMDGVPGDAKGLLRIVLPPSDLASMRALLLRNGLPPSHVQALDCDAASALAGVPIAHPAWFYPGGGWIDPEAWVQRALAGPGVRFLGGRQVAMLSAAAADSEGTGWQLHDRHGAVLARAAVVVLATGATDRPLSPMAWPLSRSRGQITFWAGSPTAATPLRMALAGAGYALPLPQGGLVCGASHEADTAAVSAGEPPALRPADHAHNLQRLQALCGLRPAAGQPIRGRAGWRLQTADRLPVVGALSPIRGVTAGGDARAAGPGRLDQARLLPRAPGLFVLTALGSRGLTWAPLLADLIAAQACGAPWPLPQDLADAIDPLRWAVRAARSAQRQG